MEVFKSPTIIASLIFAAFLGLAWHQRKRQEDAFARKQGCLPPTRFRGWDPLFGLDYILGMFTNVGKMQTFRLKFGRTFHVDPLLNVSFIVTSEPENIQQTYMSGDFGNFWRREPFVPFTGRGILTEDGESWKSARKMIRPAFAKSIIADFSFYDKVVSELRQSVPGNGETVDMHPLLLKAFMTNALHFVLGYDAMNPHPKAPTTHESFMTKWETALQNVGLRIVLGKIRGLLPTGSFNAACASVHDFVDFHVNLAHENKASEANRAMAEAFITQSDDRKYVRSQLIQGIMGAQDTTSVLTSNTLFLLAKRPDLWKEIRAQVLQQGSSFFEFDALRTNETLLNILFESLRLYPVFPGIDRCASRDTTLPRGGGPDGTAPIVVKAGTRVQPSFFALHREESVFGPDVESFNPHRWKTIKPTQWEYIPFGAGARSCLGKEKSLVESGYLIAKLASEFEVLEARDDRPWAGAIKMTASNKNGCKVAFRKSAKA